MEHIVYEKLRAVGWRGLNVHSVWKGGKGGGDIDGRNLETEGQAERESEKQEKRQKGEKSGRLKKKLNNQELNEV